LDKLDLEYIYNEIINMQNVESCICCHQAWFF